MTSDFKAGKEGTFIEESRKSKGAISLIAKGGNAEVFIQEVQQNETIVIEPGGKDLMEFFYILEGRIHYKDSDGHRISLGPNDYFYTNKLQKHVMMETDSFVKLIYFSTEPVFHYLSQTINELVEIAKKVEDKDQYTRGHLDRVGDYTIAISKKLGLTPEQIELIGQAAIFHDIGKINVPDEILNKTGKLTEEEFNIIKKHPHDGALIVQDTYYEKLSTIIDQHHERIDGTGYPNGLKGDDIMLEAKIIYVADAYDAMTSNRPYRKGMPMKNAIKELIKYKNKQFDPSVVDTVVDILNNK